MDYYFSSYTLRIYLDDITLYAEVMYLSYCINCADSLNKNLLKLNMVNSSKTHSIIIGRSRTTLPLHPPNTLCWINLEVSSSSNFWESYIMKNILLQYFIVYCPKKMVLFATVLRHLAIMDSTQILSCIFVVTFWCSAFDWH